MNGLKGLPLLQNAQESIDRCLLTWTCCEEATCGDGLKWWTRKGDSGFILCQL